ncbi:hypothetical protein VNO78_12256 [Psophocarpus tetragonolobus]|uniref:Uncharacterized protein n=1 Tax=Psophocarpus tetragonolobus TaxID=3891 RepID=A0AAN9SN20_PSOTE
MHIHLGLYEYNHIMLFIIGFTLWLLCLLCLIVIAASSSVQLRCCQLLRPITAVIAPLSTRPVISSSVQLLMLSAPPSNHYHRCSFF